MWLFELFFLTSANLICQGTDILKYFRESLGIWDNDSRLYSIFNPMILLTDSEGSDQTPQMHRSATAICPDMPKDTFKYGVALRMILYPYSRHPVSDLLLNKVWGTQDTKYREFPQGQRKLGIRFSYQILEKKKKMEWVDFIFYFRSIQRRYPS